MPVAFLGICGNMETDTISIRNAKFERDRRNTSNDESRDNWTKYTGLPRLRPGGALGQPAVMTVAAVLHCSLYYSRNHRMEQCEESPLPTLGLTLI